MDRANDTQVQGEGDWETVGKVGAAAMFGYSGQAPEAAFVVFVVGDVESNVGLRPLIGL
jgi:hypothetical protein